EIVMRHVDSPVIAKVTAYCNAIPWKSQDYRPAQPFERVGQFLLSLVLGDSHRRGPLEFYLERVGVFTSLLRRQLNVQAVRFELICQRKSLTQKRDRDNVLARERGLA